MRIERQDCAFWRAGQCSTCIDKCRYSTDSTITDLEMTKLCAEAIGMENPYHPGDTSMGAIQEWSEYDPLHDDAQAMALVKKFWLYLFHHEHIWKVEHVATRGAFVTVNADLNRAIVECVAKMQLARNDVQHSETAHANKG